MEQAIKIILLLSAAISMGASAADQDRRTFEGGGTQRLNACKVAKDRASDWARDPRSRVFANTSVSFGECNCEKSEPQKGVAGDVLKAYGADSNWTCIVDVTVNKK